MVTRSAPEQDRAAALDGTVRELLSAGNPRAARQAARQELERAAKARSEADPAHGLRVDAWLAGVLTAMAAALPGFTPPGRAGGLPSTAQLTAIYETARAETAHRR